MTEVVDSAAPKSQSSAANAVEVSLVVPMRNEAENVVPLLGEIVAALRGGERFEILAIDDGSTDGTDRALLAARAGAPELRIIRHAESCGQSGALRTGIRLWVDRVGSQIFAVLGA